MDSPQLVRTVLQQFLKWESRITSELQAAHSAGDVGQMEQAAHTLHGTLAQLHAFGGSQLAARLERGCAQQNSIPVSVHTELLTELKCITAEVIAYLDAI